MVPSMPVFAAVVLSLLAAGPARAAVPLVAVPPDTSLDLAVAGPELLLGTARKESGTVRGFSFAGGAPVMRARFRAPTGLIADVPRLAASLERIEVVFGAISERFAPERVVGRQRFGGLPGAALGPLESFAQVGADDPRPAGLAVDGPRTFTTTVDADFSSAAVSVSEAGRSQTAVALPEGAALGARFAGELVAYTQTVPGQDEEVEAQGLVVARWRSGEIVRRVRIRAGIESLALAPNGRVVVGVDRGGGLVDVLPGRAGVRRLTSNGAEPVLAGDTVIARREGRREGDQRLIAISPGGRVRGFGVPAASIVGVRADAEHVAWLANGCVLTATPEAPAQAGIDAGPCPRAELFFDDELSGKSDRSGRVALRVRCVSAPSAGCRGTIRRIGDGGYAATPRARLQIAAGSTRDVRVRLGARARRVLRRERDALFGVDMLATDAADRTSRSLDAVGVNRGSLQR